MSQLVCDNLRAMVDTMADAIAVASYNALLYAMVNAMGGVNPLEYNCLYEILCCNG